MSAKASGAQTLWQYSQAGQLLFAWKGPTAQTTHEYVYLAGSLVATIDHAWPSNAITATKYQHTDALGSPIAMSNEAGTVVERTNYDPYGGAIGKVVDGIGYTGHVMDGLTGLTNMQQLYYDQGVGRFLSVDPVSASSVNGGNFNRYWYANNNPYKFVDPDGRQACQKSIFENCTLKAPFPKNWGGSGEPDVQLSGKSGGSKRKQSSTESAAPTDSNGQPKPEGDFVLHEGTWVHRSAINALVLGHNDTQKSHVALSAGVGGGGFVLFKGRTATASASVDSSGARCGVIQICDQTGAGGYFGGGDSEQVTVQSGPTASGASTSRGAFFFFGVGGTFGGSVDASESGVSASGGRKGSGVGLAAGYQECSTETTCL